MKKVSLAIFLCTALAIGGAPAAAGAKKEIPACPSNIFQERVRAQLKKLVTRGISARDPQLLGIFGIGHAGLESLLKTGKFPAGIWTRGSNYFYPIKGNEDLVSPFLAKADMEKLGSWNNFSKAVSYAKEFANDSAAVDSFLRAVGLPTRNKEHRWQAYEGGDEYFLSLGIGPDEIADAKENSTRAKGILFGVSKEILGHFPLRIGNFDDEDLAIRARGELSLYWITGAIPLSQTERKLIDGQR